jgi:hypothetical protein
VTVSGHDTGSADYVKEYRPLFMDHFDKKETENNLRVSLSSLAVHVSYRLMKTHLQ